MSATTTIDLTPLEWTLTGWRPHAWRLRKAAETGGFLHPDHGPFSARLPGSVQENLRRAGAIPDWNVGRNSLAIEWVEHRHWMFGTRVKLGRAGPDEHLELCADCLDYSGWLLLDGVPVGEFFGAQLPVRIALPAGLAAGEHELALVFDLPPEGQGQLGFTSRAREMKARYSYGWDWCVRLVPIGAAGALWLERRIGAALEAPSVTTHVAADFASGEVEVRCRGEAEFEATLRDDFGVVARVTVEVNGEATLRLPVAQPKLWWPNGEGPQPLYHVRVTARRPAGAVAAWTFTVGFKRIEWRPCEGAPADALPWLCVINGRPIFLQGVNWTPVRMCYQDVTREETEQLVEIYRELGCNVLRVWGGAYLETPEFYAACDRAGLLVWQEFPLSSSGVDSRPPDDDAFVAQLTAVARHAIRTRQHHACLLQWCGGNELHVDGAHAGGKRRQPLDRSHRALQALSALVAAEDPSHRFLPTSAFGPRFYSTREEFGRGVHHNVHGPWGLGGFEAAGEWERYWTDDDALFRAEVGVAGASRAELIRRHAGGEAVWPPDSEWWRDASAWWTQWDRLGSQFQAAAEPGLEAYAEFTRREQAEKLAFAVAAKKAQFPRCGGFVIWMGHDAFPCLANTSLVEFDRALKPAALAVAAVFKRSPRNASAGAPLTKF